MIAIEVWINGEKKCVAGTDGHVLSAITNVHARRDGDAGGRVSVGGLIKKDGHSFHVQWLQQLLQIGDEVRIRLIETDEVDAPQTEGRYETQTEEDEKVRSLLRDVRAKLSPSAQETENATLALFEERLEQQNFVACIHILGDLGEKNSMPATYWKDLGGVAFLLRRYDESKKYREKERALTPQTEEPQ